MDGAYLAGLGSRLGRHGCLMSPVAHHRGVAHLRPDAHAPAGGLAGHARGPVRVHAEAHGVSSTGTRRWTCRRRPRTARRTEPRSCGSAAGGSRSRPIRSRRPRPGTRRCHPAGTAAGPLRGRGPGSGLPDRRGLALCLGRRIRRVRPGGGGPHAVGHRRPLRAGLADAAGRAEVANCWRSPGCPRPGRAGRAGRRRHPHSPALARPRPRPRPRRRPGRPAGRPRRRPF
jgi:hypothetical protein